MLVYSVTFLFDGELRIDHFAARADATKAARVCNGTLAEHYVYRSGIYSHLLNDATDAATLTD